LAASSRIRSTILRASAYACEGLSQPPVAANVAAAEQQRQNRRRDRVCWCNGVMNSSEERLMTTSVVHALRPRRVSLGSAPYPTLPACFRGIPACAGWLRSFRRPSNTSSHSAADASMEQDPGVDLVACDSAVAFRSTS
jgi:hypothetical protein